MSPKLKGTICGVAAAICYGTNPLGALFLYRAGVDPASVLFYRFAGAVVILGLLMLIGRKSFRVTAHEAGVLLLLGLLFAVSSLTLFVSFRHMDAGIASTLLFVYPVMVAVGIAMILAAVLLIIGGKSIHTYRLPVINRMGRMLRKVWRWK